MRNISSTTLALILFFTTNVWAAVTATSATGVSGFTGSGTATATIIGGLGGWNCEATADASTLCNSCINSPANCDPTTPGGNFPLCVCNPQRIHPNLLVQISLTRADADVGTVKAKITANGTSANAAIFPLANVDTTGSTAAFTWSQLCNVMGLGPACDQPVTTSNNTATLTIFLDKTGDDTIDPTEVQTTVNVKVLAPLDTYSVYGLTFSEGIGGFTPYPGDQKVSITKVNASSTTTLPTTSYGGIASKVRVFYAKTSLNDAYAGGAGVLTQDFDIDTNELVQNKVTGLQNDTYYFFRVAIVDDGGNIVQYYPAYPNTNNDPNFAQCLPGFTDASMCPFAAYPSEVVGLLTKDLNCFIATAAYGSPLEPKLNTFRAFRNKILLSHSWGVWLVDQYYDYGPRAALLIYDKPNVRAVVRAMLWPMYGFTWLSLQVGLLAATLSALLVLSLLIALPWYTLRRTGARA